MNLLGNTVFRAYCTQLLRDREDRGVFLTGKTWNIPKAAGLPMRKSFPMEVMPLLAILREQKKNEVEGGIYHRTQIDLTYNSITSREVA